MCNFCVDNPTQEVLDIDIKRRGPQPVMYGNVHYIARTTPLRDAVSEGMTWAVQDFVKTMAKIGADPAIAATWVRTYFTPATEEGGGNHVDPLVRRPYPELPTLHGDHVFGWKVGLMVEGDVPEYSRVLEGSRIQERNDG